MPARLAVLLNPVSGRVRRRRAALRALARAMAGERYAEASEPAGMAAAVAGFGLGGDDVLCVIGGDGTLHAVLTALERRRADGVWPIVAAAPGGTTNMTARGLGPTGRLVPWLEALRGWAERAGSAGAPDGEPGAGAAGRLVLRPVLRVGRPAAEPLAGAFLGAGAVSAGVVFYERRLKPTGIPERVGSPIAFLGMLGALALGRRALDRVASPMRVEVDGNLTLRGPGVLLALSTLGRVIMGARPFWGTGGGPLHLTFVERTATALFASVPRGFVGRPGRRMTPEHGWHSHDAARIELTLEGPYIVDGELHQARAADGPLEITASRVVRWWVP